MLDFILQGVISFALILASVAMLSRTIHCLTQKTGSASFWSSAFATVIFSAIASFAYYDLIRPLPPQRVHDLVLKTKGTAIEADFKEYLVANDGSLDSWNHVHWEQRLEKALEEQSREELVKEISTPPLPEGIDSNDPRLALLRLEAERLKIEAEEYRIKLQMETAARDALVDQLNN